MGKANERERKNSPGAWIDPDNAPEITDEWIGGAELREVQKVVRRGRSPGGTKTPTTVRLDNDVLDAFRATGQRWQSCLNAALADWLKRLSSGESAV
jgi:uncharacterized protein (DUF4415 family)